MGYTLVTLLRFRCPTFFAEIFKKKFTWRGSWYQVPCDPNSFYIDDYHQFAAFERTSSLDTDQLKLDKLDVLKQSDMVRALDVDSNCLQLILEFADTQVTELMYQFRIWKDNFYVYAGGQMYGAGTNVKKVVCDIMYSHPDFNHYMKCFGIKPRDEKYFRMTVAVLDAHSKEWFETNELTRLCSTYEQDWWKFVLDRKRYDRDGVCFMPDQLPHWLTKYPAIFHIKMKDVKNFTNEWKQEGWIEFTKQLKSKLDNQKYELFNRAMDIEIIGLKSKPQLNGMKCVVIGEYDFERERYPVRIVTKSNAKKKKGKANDKPQIYMIKSMNLNVLGQKEVPRRFDVNNFFPVH